MIEKVLKILETDKSLHFLVGFFITVIFQWPLRYEGLIVAIILGVVKEMYDRLHYDRHTCDIWDVISTISGAIIGFLTILIY